MSRVVLIDSDVGADDAVALLLALKNHNSLGIKIVGITVVFGNVPVGNATSNVSRILDVVDQDIPLYKGASEPMVGKFQLQTWGGFGTDGLGDGLPLELYPGKRKAEPLHAVQAIIHAAHQYPKQLEIIALGPLTNLALALKLDPSIGKLIKSVFIMGGTTSGMGNATAAAEFNIHMDPEAAAVVFESEIPITMISWELTRSTAVPIETWWREWTSRNTPIGNFVKQISTRWAEHELANKIDEFVVCDAVAVAVAFYPHLVLEQVHHNVSVELAGSHTRGMTVIDWYNRRQDAAQHPHPQNKTRLIRTIDTKKYIQLLEDLVRE